MQNISRLSPYIFDLSTHLYIQFTCINTAAKSVASRVGGYIYRLCLSIGL